MTTVVNLRKDEYDVYIGRGRKGLIPDPPEYGCFGNPFDKNTRSKNIADFKEYFDSRIKNDPKFKEAILTLKDKRIACFCKPLPCHGDVIAEWLDKNEKI